jgi:hypothetical protein
MTGRASGAIDAEVWVVNASRTRTTVRICARDSHRARGGESYGLGDGPGGADSVSTYTNAKANGYDAKHPDCGGGWMVYMGQSMPGLGNQAKSVDGKPMLNWWTFLFY